MGRKKLFSSAGRVQVTASLSAEQHEWLSEVGARSGINNMSRTIREMIDSHRDQTEARALAGVMVSTRSLDLVDALWAVAEQLSTASNDLLTRGSQDELTKYRDLVSLQRRLLIEYLCNDLEVMSTTLRVAQEVCDVSATIPKEKMGEVRSNLRKKIADEGYCILTSVPRVLDARAQDLIDRVLEARSQARIDEDLESDSVVKG